MKNRTPGKPITVVYLRVKSVCQRDICTTIFIAALFTIAPKWKQPKCPSVDGWLK
jgi:hypothetical protein